MPANIAWFNPEKTIIHHIYTGDIALDDYLFMADNSAEMIRSVDHTVHIIFDRSKANKTPPQNLSRALRYANQHSPENQGVKVIVGASLITRIMVDAAKTIAPRLAKDVYFAENLETAERIIMEKAGILEVVIEPKNPSPGQESPS